MPESRRDKGRWWLVVSLVAFLAVTAFLPPLVSVSRYRRRVASSMSQVLGRPVHLDHVALHVLPFPSLTITHLVIDDLPPFGQEPMLQANTVDARLRLWPLWRHRVEFSRITFDEPSVNLVRLSDGRWNLESLLLQASHIDAAPTSQRTLAAQPRFPYITATGARVNMKVDQVKSPYSLTEADLALWLPETQEWKLRLRGKPSRTDTAASDTGLLQAEATLHAAPSLGLVPIAMTTSWTDAPLGEASRILLGHDANLRGTLHLAASLDGVLGSSQLVAKLKLSDLHRVDVVSGQPVTVNLSCRAELTDLLRQAHSLACDWPLDGNLGEVLLWGEVPNLVTPGSARLELDAAHIPAAAALHWIRAATGLLPADLIAAGEVHLQANYTGDERGGTAEASAQELRLGRSRPGTLLLGPLHLHASLNRKPPDNLAAGLEFSLAPTTMRWPDDTSADFPSALTVSLEADGQGVSVRLAGTATTANLKDLAVTLPFLANVVQSPVEEQSNPVKVEFRGYRPWGQPIQWNDVGAIPSPAIPSRRRLH